jgi:hypothetical protein
VTEAADFLAAHGFARAVRKPLAGDAGFRRYTRLLRGPRPALLMQVMPAAPGGPPREDLGAFLRIGAYLRANGLAAPEVFAADPARGLAIIEDFGPHTHADLLDDGAEPSGLYAEAAETLAGLQAAPTPSWLPAWDAPAMAAATAATFLEWWWPASLGTTPTPGVRREFHDALLTMLCPFADTRSIVHRDYFPANLIRLPDVVGPRRTGLIDFQDAAIGHPAYDLLSLIDDARRDVPPAARNAAIETYLAHRPPWLWPAGDAEALDAALAAFGAQRHLRVAALWVRLAMRDGKPGYLVHGPRCWAMLEQALRHAACTPLRKFLDRHVPPDRRRNPERPEAAA